MGELDKSNLSINPFLDSLPPVTFSTDLGRRYQSVNFDYDAYADYLRIRGSTEEQIVATSIHFDIPRHINRLTGLNSGYYRPSSDSIKVVVPKYNPSDRASTEVAEFVQHKLDYDQGRVSTTDRATRAALGVFTVAGSLSFAGKISTGAIDFLEKNNAASHDVNNLLPKVFAISIIVGGISWVLNPTSRRAYMAAVRNNSGFATFVSRA